MLQHEEISINADEAVPQRSFLCLGYNLSPIFLAYQMNKALLGVSCQKVCSKIGQLDLSLLFLANYSQSLKVLTYLHQYSMFSKGSHSDVYQFFVLILLDDGNHLISDERFSLELECFVAIGIIEDHLINLNGYSLHLFHFILLLHVLSQSRREQQRIFLHHCILISKITSKENGAHIPLEENHGSTRYMFCIEECKAYVRQAFSNGETVSLVVIVRIHVFQFGVFIVEILGCLMSAVDVPIVPQRGDSFIVVTVKVRQEVMEGAPWE